jgi:hypothetical protein
LKPVKNVNHGSTHAPKAREQHDHDPGGPRGPPGRRSRMPLEYGPPARGQRAPSCEVRLARGPRAPSGKIRLARGPRAPSGEIRLARGPHAPSGEVRLARGINTPLGGVCLARGHLHARCPRSCPRVRAFNALATQDARRDLGTPGNHVPALFHQLPGGGHPRRCVALCGEAGVTSVTLCRLPLYG